MSSWRCCSVWRLAGETRGWWQSATSRVQGMRDGATSTHIRNAQRTLQVRTCVRNWKNISCQRKRRGNGMRTKMEWTVKFATETVLDTPAVLTRGLLPLRCLSSNNPTGKVRDGLGIKIHLRQNDPRGMTGHNRVHGRTRHGTGPADLPLLPHLCLGQMARSGITVMHPTTTYATRRSSVSAPSRRSVLSGTRRHRQVWWRFGRLNRRVRH